MLIFFRGGVCSKTPQAHLAYFEFPQSSGSFNVQYDPQRSCVVLHDHLRPYMLMYGRAWSCIDLLSPIWVPNDTVWSQQKRGENDKK